MEEHFFQCPYCWEEVSILLDPSVKKNVFIEDCEVCCNPLEFSVQFENEQLINFTVNQFQ
ncbi:CPXCG motif-containing cysteine-rich protein [Lutibacter maritimus]|jgi:transcription elongation factor Elf1|uniref:Cysteine-rich CPXCG n=1 Tax=Lutibacter maritimus TaxID=593133 RepID=A0A1I6P1F0_9FLAO|nr:CPXCG motif-containing cysteine-rich protein [Lutibacter maritimus]SFS33918.1 Cysteine-rich CPXCG [Lutibacter maritimus]